MAANERHSNVSIQTNGVVRATKLFAGETEIKGVKSISFDDIEVNGGLVEITVKLLGVKTKSPHEVDGDKEQKAHESLANNCLISADTKNT